MGRTKTPTNKQAPPCYNSRLLLGQRHNNFSTGVFSIVCSVPPQGDTLSQSVWGLWGSRLWVGSLLFCAFCSHSMNPRKEGCKDNCTTSFMLLISWSIFCWWDRYNLVMLTWRQCVSSTFPPTEPGFWRQVTIEPLSHPLRWQTPWVDSALLAESVCSEKATVL